MVDGVLGELLVNALWLVAEAPRARAGLAPTQHLKMAALTAKDLLLKAKPVMNKSVRRQAQVHVHVQHCTHNKNCFLFEENKWQS